MSKKNDDREEHLLELLRHVEAAAGWNFHCVFCKGEVRETKDAREWRHSAGCKLAKELGLERIPEWIECD